MGERALVVDGTPIEPRGRPLAMEDYARVLAGALDLLGVRRAALVGCSMGGYALLAFARLFPERLAAAVLICTRADADSAEARAKRETQAQAVLLRGAGEVTGPLETTLLAPGAAQSEPAVLARLRELLTAATAQGIADAQRGMALRPDSTALLSRFPAPALVIGGEQDQLIPRAALTALSSGIPGARLELLAGAGHLAFLEQPERVADLSTEFILSTLQH